MRPKKDAKAPLRLTQTQVFWTEGGGKLNVNKKYFTHGKISH